MPFGVKNPFGKKGGKASSASASASASAGGDKDSSARDRLLRRIARRYGARNKASRGGGALSGWTQMDANVNQLDDDDDDASAISTDDGEDKKSTKSENYGQLLKRYGARGAVATGEHGAQVLYITGDFNADGRAKSSVLRFDLSHDCWLPPLGSDDDDDDDDDDNGQPGEKKGNGGGNGEGFPVRHFHVSCVAGGYLWIQGGKSTRYTDDIWRFPITAAAVAEQERRLGGMDAASAGSDDDDTDSGSDSESLDDTKLLKKRSGQQTELLRRAVWEPVKPSAGKDGKELRKPGARYGHSGVVVARKLFIFGGYDDMSSACNDTWSFNFESLRWKKVEAAGTAPPARFHHTATAYKEGMFVFGGCDEGGKCVAPDVWYLDLNENSWAKVDLNKDSAAITGRKGHSMFVHDSDLHVFGGATDQAKEGTNELWSFNIDSSLWSQPTKSSDGDGPSARMFHTCVADGSFSYVFGGRGEDMETMGDLWRQNFLTCYLDLVPDEIMKNVLGYLTADAADLARMMQTSRRYFALVDTNELWQVVLDNLNRTRSSNYWSSQITANPGDNVRQVLYERWFNFRLHTGADDSRLKWRNPKFWG